MDCFYNTNRKPFDTVTNSSIILWEASRVRCGGERSSLLIVMIQRGLEYGTEIYWPCRESHQLN